MKGTMLIPAIRITPIGCSTTVMKGMMMAIAMMDTEMTIVMKGTEMSAVTTKENTFCASYF
jgi:hypothetical protein